MRWLLILCLAQCPMAFSQPEESNAEVPEAASLQEYSGRYIENTRWLRLQGEPGSPKHFEYMAADKNYRPAHVVKVAGMDDAPYKEGDILFYVPKHGWFGAEAHDREIERPLNDVPLRGSDLAYPYEVAIAQARYMAATGKLDSSFGYVRTNLGPLVGGYGAGNARYTPTAVALNGTAAVADAQVRGESGMWYRARLYKSGGTVDPASSRGRR